MACFDSWCESIIKNWNKKSEEISGGKNMFKRMTVKLLALMMVCLVAGIEVSAQTRIRFARGRASATVSGTISPKSNRAFVVRASDGQFARVSVSPRGLKIFSDAAPKGESGSSSFDTFSGDNEFGLYNPTNRTIRYTMTISIRWNFDGGD